MDTLTIWGTNIHYSVFRQPMTCQDGISTIDSFYAIQRVMTINPLLIQFDSEE